METKKKKILPPIEGNICELWNGKDPPKIEHEFVDQHRVDSFAFGHM